MRYQPNFLALLASVIQLELGHIDGQESGQKTTINLKWRYETAEISRNPPMDFLQF